MSFHAVCDGCGRPPLNRPREVAAKTANETPVILSLDVKTVKGAPGHLCDLCFRSALVWWLWGRAREIGK